MSVPLIVRQLEIPQNKRLIVIADIHGELDLFKKLLDKVKFCNNDVLVILGDFYLKGSQPEETFRYIMELDKQPNVHVLRGNCEWGRADFYTDEDWEWVCNLAIVLESEDFIFVHAGLEDKPLNEQDVIKCLTIPAFTETYKGKPFDKWVIVGHWPINNLCHQIPCCNPIINKEKHIIHIDGGYPIAPFGQLNAFIVKDGEFSWEFVENFELMTVENDHKGKEGTLSITWNDRFVDILEYSEEFSKVRHKSGKILEVPTDKILQDDEGRNWVNGIGTDHYLSLKRGNVVSVVATYSNKIFAKFNGTAGWLNL
ncbi:MAG: metallophosphoesterase [Defluviitaleaceae bacterium]|nr:metallophosphoesterase [Defluviitaleaceae bacterium]